MKKVILLLLLFLFSNLSNAQHFKLPTPNSEGFTDMVVYDREGNLYHLDNLKFPMPDGGSPSIMTIPPTCVAGIFRLHFADSGTGQGFDDLVEGPARQAVACQVFTDLSQLINEAGSPYTSIANLGTGTSYVEINVQTSLNNSSNPTLGTAGQFFLTTTPGIVHGSVWQTINSGIDAWFGVNASNLGTMGIFHGQMQINFGHPFYSGTNPLLIPPGDFDLYTVILHEGIHALGFGSLIDQNGNSKLTSTNPGIFSIYDTYLEDVATTNRLVNWNGCYVAGTSIAPLSKLTTPCTITFDGTNSAFVSSDPTWSNGTSLSHYPIGTCGNPGNYSMNPSAAPGVTRRFPDIAEVTTLCDIGYSTSGTYPGAVYPPSGICGTRIAGTNDYATYTISAPGTNYSTPNNTSFVFNSTDILGNDENAAFYDCLEVANGSGTITGATSGGTGINITFNPNTGFAGVAILRYIPRISPTGTRGNITYIFITVMPPPLPPCAPATCEMVCYGGFEEFTSQLQYDLYTLGGNSTGNSFSYNAVTFPDNSPDLFGTGFFGFGSHVSCGTASGPITAFAGTQFIALILRNDFSTSVNSPEGPAFPLNGSILPGETVTVTMWSRLAHSSCMGGVEVRFTNMAPCTGPTYPTLASCAGLVQSVPVASGALANNSLWQPLNFVYTNTTGVTLTHLLINSLPYAIYNSPPLGFLFIDDVSCIKDTPNLTVTKTGPANACPGEVITYNIDICNTSAFPAPSLQITDVLSTGLSLAAGGSFTYPTQTLPVLPPGGCQNYTLNATVTASLGTVTNTANVSSGGCLSNTTTNNVTTTVNPPTLSITQTVSNTSPAAGSTITLTVDICNYTNAPVTNINVETSVPAANTIAAGPGYTVSPGLITFTTFNLPAGTITSPACSTFVIPITVNCPGSGNICTTILSGGNICANQNNCTMINVAGSTTVVAEPNITVCAGAVVPTNTFASTPPGATFTWTNSNTSIGLAASGSTSTPSFTATNSTSAPITATITITPTLSGCAGPASTYTITVNPSPIVVTEPNITACNGGFVPANSFASTPPGATFTWTTSTAIGLPASGTGGTPPFAAVNTTGSPIVCTVTVTPTLGGCTGPTSTFTITVNPSPTVVAEPNISVCAGAVIPLNSFTSIPPGATFTWTNSNTAIGLAASGSGSVPSFTATNTTTSPITATITILATLAGCPGPFSSYTITVNPIPVVIVSPSSATILSGGNVTLVASGASTYTWSPSTGLSCTSCATTVASPTTTTTYVVTGTAFGCSSTATVTVTVVPACASTPNFLAPSYSSSITHTGSLWSPTAFNTVITGGATVTLNNIRLVMPAGSKITVNPGCILRLINTTRIWACTDNMWQGIEVLAGGRIEMSGGSSIEDAENAVHIMNSTTTEAQFQIIGSVFNKNFKGIVVDPYPLVHNGQLHGSTFNSIASTNTPNSPMATLSTLKIPHVTVPARRANMGVEITNVAQITLGSTTAGNLFTGIEVGIHSTQNTKLFSVKNIFRNIAYGSCGSACFVPNTGIGIWADKSGSIIVGGSPASANTFNICANGIITNQNVNVDAQRNTFQTIAASLFFPCRAIGIDNESGNLINIRNNTFRDFRDGVVIRFYNQTTAVVADNDFKKFPKGYGIYSLQNINSTFIAQNNQYNNTLVDYGATAIRVQNVSLVSNGVVDILGNVVRNCIAGIVTTNINGPNISSLNDVKFNLSSPPTTVHYGIRVMNCPNSKVNDNLVWKQGGVTAGSSYNNFLYAYTFDVGCMGSAVTNNRSIRMNDGYRFAGSTNNPLTFGCNFSSFDYFGLELNTTAIGNQGVPSISAEDNQWTLPSISTYPGRKGATNIASSIPIFYTRSMAYPFAVSAGDQSPFGGAVTFTLTSPLDYYCTYGCEDPPCYHQVVSKIAKKEDPYDALSDNATSITFTHAYAEVMRDSTIYQQGTPDDVVIVNFKDSLSMTNFGTLYEVGRMFQDGDTTGARLANAAIVPKDCKEQSHKIVNEIYGRTWAKGIFEFSASDESALQTIADYYVEDCGIAVYDARVMLRYDKDDFPVLSHSMLTMSQGNHDSYGVMYPNPANTVAYYEAELLENESGFVQLYDLLGNLVATQKLVAGPNKAEFDLNTIANGIYVYKVIINEELRSSNKLVITK